VFNFRYQGQYFDQETNTSYNYFRNYDPATGRYVESDPIGLYGGSASTYGYVKGRPLSLRDPFGLFGFPSHVSITNSALGDDPNFPGLGLNVAGVDFMPGLQDPENSYMHAMRDGTTGQSVGTAERLYNEYINDQVATCTQIGLARALHAVEDSAARGHRGFQPWTGGAPTPAHIAGDFDPTDAEVAEAVQKARDVIARFKAQCPCFNKAAPQNTPAPGEPGSRGSTD
jgi:RHS repeat-associated protein